MYQYWKVKAFPLTNNEKTGIEDYSFTCSEWPNSWPSAQAQRSGESEDFGEPKSRDFTLRDHRGYNFHVQKDFVPKVSSVTGRNENGLFIHQKGDKSSLKMKHFYLRVGDPQVVRTCYHDGTYEYGTQYRYIQ